MKKGIIMCATIGVFVLDTTNGMVALYNQDNGAIVKRDIAESDVCRIDCAEKDYWEAGTLAIPDEVRLSQVDVRQILQPELNGEILSVRIRDCKDNELINEWYKDYPLIREFLRYEHDFAAGKSYPVMKLFANVSDIELADTDEAIFDPEFEDEEHALTHQRRGINRYEMDDANLQARQFSEIFISTESGDQVIDEAKIRECDNPVSYTRTSTPPAIRKIGDPEVREDDNEFDYQRTETTEEWIRPDGTIFTKKTEGVEKISKPKQPASLPPKPITVTIPVHHWNKGSTFRGGHWDWNVRYETVTIQPGEPVPTAIELNSNWSFCKYLY